MRYQAISSAAVLLVVFCGCVSPEQHQQVEFQLQKVAGERDSCQQTLHDEKARATALAERLRSWERQLAAAQAEVNALRGRAKELQRQNDEFMGLIEERASQKLERPAVPVSPLPPDLDRALTRYATKYQQRVWYDRGRGALSLANDRLFESGSDSVRTDAYAALHEFANIVGQVLPEHFEVVVVGHSDDTAIKKAETLAKHPTNWHLSVHRAIAVKDVLVKAGLPARRLAVMGYGPYRPVSDDRSRNRRVELFLVRTGEVQTFAPVQKPDR